MADLVVIAANVKPGSDLVTKRGIAGETISAGDSLFIATDGELELCEKDQAVADAACVGVAVNDAAALQPVEYGITGTIDMGAILAIGQTYIVGAGPGGLAPEADAAVGNFTTVVGIATTANILKLGILQSGVAHA
jgi:hypothetical protein